MALEKYRPPNQYRLLDQSIGARLDADFNAIARTISRMVDVLAVLARDDSRLANSTVHLQALTGDLLRLIQGNLGNWKLRGQWLEQRFYEYGDIVEYNGEAYGCNQTHTASTDFLADKSAGVWQIITSDTGESVTLAYVNGAIETAQFDTLTAVSQIYLTALDAANTYATQSLVSTQFLSIAQAANTYLTLQQAAQTYATIQSLQNYAPINSPKFTGIPEAPSPTSGDVSNKIATTSFVAQNFDAIGKMQVFTQSGNWVVPAGVFKCEAIVVGGGALNQSDGIGATGGYAQKIISGLTQGQVISVVVGAGGQTPNAGSSVSGGQSNFGAFCRATGGSYGSTLVQGVGLDGDINSSGGYFTYGLAGNSGIVIVRW